MRLGHYVGVMSARILLATTVIWPSAARLAGAFAESGATVEAIFPAGHMLGQSRYLSGTHRHAPLFPLRSLASAITRAEPDLVVPCDDRATAQLLALARGAPRHAPLIERSFGSTEAYSDLIARSIFIQAARAAGIRAPETISISSEPELEAALQHFGYPAVLKADGSYGGEGVVVVRNLEQAVQGFRRLSASASRLRNVARAFTRRDFHFLRNAIHAPAAAISLQRFVAGAPATTAFACWKGRVLASVHMDVLETLNPTGPASVMRRVDCPDMEQAANRIAARFGLSGLHGLDFVRDAYGRAHLIEINPRATQASPLALGAGHDLTAALVGCVSRGALGARPILTDNPVIALFPQEWRRNPQSDWLKSAYLDAAWDDPAVLRACLEPTEAPPPRPAGVSALVPAVEKAPLTVRQAVGR